MKQKPAQSRKRGNELREVNPAAYKHPPTFEPEKTTVWDFPVRGTWATHRSDYRGNFAPQIATNIISNYSREGDTVLDPMVGSGTTLIEARLLNRNGKGFDINPEAIAITRERLSFEVHNTSSQDVNICDARMLGSVADNSVDLILTHPPYANLVQYSGGTNPQDLSSIKNIGCFLSELECVVKELYRVLKPDRYCAILMGDTRKGQHYIPLSYYLLQMCLGSGFALKEEIIKTQHNCTYSKRWAAPAKTYKFYLIMHEHLFVFRKPRAGENLSPIRYSVAPRDKE